MYKNTIVFCSIAAVSTLAGIGFLYVFDFASFSPTNAAVPRAFESELTKRKHGNLLVMTKHNAGATTSIQLFHKDTGNYLAIATGKRATLENGEYILITSNKSEDSLLFSGDCDSSGHVRIEAESTATCLVTITDTMPHGTLVITSTVVNDDLGNALSEDFVMFANDHLLASLVPATLPAGEYTIREEGPGGYASRLEGDCEANGRVTIPPHGRAECTIVHDDITPDIGVLAITPDGPKGGLAPDEIEFYVNGILVDTSTATTVPVGTHVVEALDGTGDSLRLGGDCEQNGRVLVPAGHEAVCTVTKYQFTQM